MNRLFFWLLMMLVACAPMPIPTTLPSASPTMTALPTHVAGPPTVVPTSTSEPTRASGDVSMPTRTRTLTSVVLDYERNPRAILIEADTFGGANSVPREAHVPMFRLYADGLVVFAGERTDLTRGLDATVQVGRLTEQQIQTLLNDLYQTGFFTLSDDYEPRVKSPGAAIATISVYLTRAKTVRVYAPDEANAPPEFNAAYALLQRARPPDASLFTPTEAFLSATYAGSTTEMASATWGEWREVNLRLADLTDSVTISGSTFNAVAALVGKNYPTTLFREGERIYRVRLVPTLPRTAPLTDWLGTILNAPREFDGRMFEIIGYFRGWNAYGEARGNPPVSRSDWVIADASGAMYVTGAPPRGLDPASRRDAWTVIRLRATVNYVRLGTSHLEARRVDLMPFDLATPTPISVALPLVTATSVPTATRLPSTTPTATRMPSTPTATRVIPTRTPVPSINTAEAAIALIKTKFPEVAHVRAKSANALGATTDITVILPRQDAWLIVFWEGWGDCPSGCINQRYTYFAVERDGRVTKVGEYSRVFNAEKNAFEEKGSPLWGVP